MSKNALDTWFVVYAGAVEDNKEADLFPLAVPVRDSEEEALAKAAAAFEESIVKAQVSSDRGLYLVKLTGVKPAQLDTVDDYTEIQTVIRKGWKGYNVEIVKSYESSHSDWLPAAFEGSDPIEETADAPEAQEVK